MSICRWENYYGKLQLTCKIDGSNSEISAEVANNGPNAEAIKQSIDQGVLISKDISLSLLSNAMEKLNAESQARFQLNANFIIDGYPSSLDRAESFEEMVRQKCCFYGDEC